MYPAQFEYYRAKNLEDALRLLSTHSEAKLLAGGHSLIPMMKLRLAHPSALIDVGRVPELAGVQVENDRVRIGALTTHAQLMASETIQRRCPMLVEAARQLADAQVRNRGTIGGNVAHADPGSDLPAVLVALGGEIVLTGPEGERHVAASDFFLDLLLSDVRPEEIILRIEVPGSSAGTGSCYLKFEHPASGYAVCGAAAWLALDDSGRCHSAELCFNGVSATPYRATAVSEALVGRTLDGEIIGRAVEEGVQIADPMGDLYASGPYRAHLARVYGKRAFGIALQRARESI